MLVKLVLIIAISTGGCSSEYQVAELEAGGGRSIIITAERYPDQDRPVYFRVEENGELVVPNTYISSEEPDSVKHLNLIGER
jgi:hypothetical protein